MARKKKQPTDEPQENLDNSDDTFGLPEVDYQPLKRDEPKAEEPVEPEEPTVSEEKVVVINETNEVTPEPVRTETHTFQYTAPEPTDTSDENVFEGKDHTEAEHAAYQPTYNYEEERPSVWPKVLGVLFILLLAGAAIWYFANRSDHAAVSPEPVTPAAETPEPEPGTSTPDTDATAATGTRPRRPRPRRPAPRAH